jgi:hypothetical protein
MRRRVNFTSRRERVSRIEPVVLGWDGDTPIVPARREPLARSRTTDLLVVHCPLCRRLHTHGAAGKTFGSGNGSRVPHCDPTPATGSYILREVEP